MPTIIFTNENCKPQLLYPFTQIRHVQDIRVGILTIREKWEKALQMKSCNKWQNTYLDNGNSVKINKNINDIYLMITSNILPTKSLIAAIKKLKNGEAIILKGVGKIVCKFSAKEIFSVNKIKISKKIEIDEDIKIVQYPWQIFQFNDWALRNDFELLTVNRKSKKISKTNIIINQSQIFIEEGVNIEHCILNASFGPIYIGKNVEIMEGSMIRGACAIGENSLLKMGTKIYGATSFGPYCFAGGEIKNSVFLGYSNKGHDGYLGDSVIGEWCNLGAGTSNSNIKNNCSDVAYWVEAEQKEISAGNKGGLILGDYSKAAINTSFNTGTVVGIGCNVFTTGLTPKFIPDFSWGKDDKIKYKIKNILSDINKWKQLKGFAITEKETKILTDICKIIKPKNKICVNK